MLETLFVWISQMRTASEATSCTDRQVAVGLLAGSCVSMFPTCDDVIGTPSHLRMGSRQFSAFPVGSHGDVPPMCPGGLTLDI